MNRVGRLAFGCVASLSLLAWLGCGQPPAPKLPKAESDAHADHDHGHDHAAGDHEHGETFADEYQELDEARANLKDAFAAGDSDKAHAAVHEAGHATEELKEMVKGDDVPADKRDELAKAIDDLFDCFESIDNKLEGREGKEYNDVAERIDAGMATLKAEADRQGKK